MEIVKQKIDCINKRTQTARRLKKKIFLSKTNYILLIANKSRTKCVIIIIKMIEKKTHKFQVQC